MWAWSATVPNPAPDPEALAMVQAMPLIPERDPMRATPLLACTAAALLLAGAADLSARWADEAAIRQTVQYYFDGGKNRDSVALRKAFHPDARMLFAKDGKLVVVPIGEYIARVAGTRPKPGEVDSTRRRVTSVDVTGDAAIARIELQRPDMVVTDYMSLLKVNGRWQIVTKIFTRGTRPEHVSGS
jgi:Putative lumazine-binding